ncbi:uncharacterized protein LOC106474694 isoform X1 [Limulus polyphemus]|uniref:Uncharacterized protein LOC106474694 isoform X1 n=1 Tax=Limulus polyphemus TaxID=6850 RepID=A0ABM1TS50_LIMPO|nr:uncharacterized protein LOC106474694 isoform X1 [Limulus polyphemus]
MACATNTVSVKLKEYREILGVKEGASRAILVALSANTSDMWNFLCQCQYNLGCICTSNYEVKRLNTNRRAEEAPDTYPNSDELKVAYKKKALQCHPDKNQDDHSATEKFQKLNEAFRTLVKEDDSDSICFDDDDDDLF